MSSKFSPTWWPRLLGPPLGQCAQEEREVGSRHCCVTVTMGFASGEPHTAITASPMLRVSKRLIANVFREPEVEAARLLQRRNHLIDNYRDFTRDFSADRVQSTSHDRGSGLELRATQRPQIPVCSVCRHLQASSAQRCPSTAVRHHDSTASSAKRDGGHHPLPQPARRVSPNLQRRRLDPRRLAYLLDRLQSALGLCSQP